MKISDSLRFKRDLVENTTKHRSVYGNIMLSSFKHIGTKVDLSPLEISSLDNVVNHLGFDSLPTADVFFVGKNVQQEYLNRALGPEPKRFGTVFPYTRSGIVVFEQPLILDPSALMINHDKGYMTEDEWNSSAANFIPITALSWSVGSVPTASWTTGEEQLNQRPGCVLMLWSATSDVKKSWERMTGEKLGPAAYPVYPLTYASAAFGGWFIAESGLFHEDEDPSMSIYYNGDTPETASGATAVVMAHELWAMLEERILVSSRQKFSSKYAKMFRRLNMTDTNVSIITLRQREYVGEFDSEGNPIDWQYRWTVRGHYRRIQDRVTGEERLVWVRGYLKGPEDKPLRETEKINALLR